MKINPNQYIKTIEDSIKFMVFNRCGLNTGEIEGSIAFERIFDFNERYLTLVLGETITPITETILREIEVEVYSINRELRRRYNEKENSTREKERNYLGVRGNRWNTIPHNGHIQRSRDGQTTREVWESSQDISKGKPPPHEIQSSNDRWGTNAPLMHKVDKEAKERLEVLEKQLLKKNPIKNPENFYETYRHRQMIRDMAEEIVLKEIVYKER